MPRLALSVAALFVLAALPNLVAATNYPRASGTPSLCPVCPPADLGAFPVDYVNDDGTILFCSYPVEAGEDPNDFYCTYDRDGALIQDADAGLCIPEAALEPCLTRRDDNFKAMKRRRAARAHSGARKHKA